MSARGQQKKGTEESMWHFLHYRTELTNQKRTSVIFFQFRRSTGTQQDKYEETTQKMNSQ